MATQTSTTDACRRPYRFTVTQLERMIETGVIPDSTDVELIRGRLYRMTKNEPHSFSVEQIADLLRPLFPREGFNVREEKSMAHDRRSMPEPDVAVVRGGRGVFRPRLRSTSEAVLIVEVCHSTKRADYHDKLSLYAEAGAPAYWIVDLEARAIIVHTEPTSHGPRGVFERVEAFADDASVPVVLDGRELGRIAVKDVLPPKS
ncbi:MAG: Uma2 family endonuclease [Paludisphaera borealis]|uniref:Uma2 family endonuclease n=1 Tax=Paludisphaera borealis TaxID=1387353 RepID=UPI00284E5D8D|nr:Uma2 family endonuclease [Paludisphaera borealis]MDR3621855.1 Uma2 family endonuclease [Paludisphaera borealis]